MPYVIRALCHADPDPLMLCVELVEQTEVDTRGVFRIEGEIHALAGKCCTQWVSFSCPYPHFVHTSSNPYCGSFYCRSRTGERPKFHESTSGNGASLFPHKGTRSSPGFSSCLVS